MRLNSVHTAHTDWIFIVLKVTVSVGDRQVPVLKDNLRFEQLQETDIVLCEERQGRRRPYQTLVSSQYHAWIRERGSMFVCIM